MRLEEFHISDTFSLQLLFQLRFSTIRTTRHRTASSEWLLEAKCRSNGASENKENQMHCAPEPLLFQHHWLRLRSFPFCKLLCHVRLVTLRLCLLPRLPLLWQNGKVNKRIEHSGLTGHICESRRQLAEPSQTRKSSQRDQRRGPRSSKIWQWRREQSL